MTTDRPTTGQHRKSRMYPPRTWPRVASLVSVCAFPMVVAPPADAALYVFDQRRTEVRFIFKMALSTQRGRFTKVNGTLDYSPTAPEKSKVTASISAASLSTDEPYVESELKSAAFFNADASPVIVFRSLAVTPRSSTEADLSGEITINGITRPVTLAVSIAPHDDPALKYDAGTHKFVARARILRSAFKMTKYKSLVDDEIELEIEAIVRPR